MTFKEVKEILEKMNYKEKLNLSYIQIKDFIEELTADEIIEISKLIGYPVFTRLCMNELKHKFVLLQDGAAAIIVNDKGQILMQKRADKNNWGLPGGCQELGESFLDTVIREVKEETNLDVNKEDPILLDVISGMSRRNSYSNGDVVINNTVLYLINKYSGSIKFDEESKDMKFFDLDKIPEEQNDPDLIEAYKKYINVQK